MAAGPALAAGEIEVWRVPVTPANAAVAAAVGETLLDPAENARAAGFRRAEDRALYQVAHVALRTLLAPRVGRPAADLPFRRAACPGCGGPHGRPEVATDGAPLEFSLSHAPGLALVALAADPVGVDVEHRPAFTSAAAADVAGQLHPDERAELAGLAGVPERWTAAVLRCWVRKEAYLKGTGMGLGMGVGQDYVGLDEGASEPAGWALRTVEVSGAYDGAVALRVPAGAAVRLTVADLALEAAAV
jgi:4'-phosphopantetheinyl transferase